MTKPTMDRPITLRARADVLATAVEVPESGLWIVRDPLALELLELSATQFAILQRLAKRASLRELLAIVTFQLAPQRVTVEWVWQLVSELHRCGLLVSDQLDQSAARAEQPARTGASGLRWRGVNPDAGLHWAARLLGPLLGPAGGLAWGSIVVSGALLAATHARELAAAVRDSAALAEPGAILWLTMVLVAVKLVHELSHGLAAKRLGCTVPELGVVLLGIVPCLYCDVTDCWRLPRRGQRMFVTAAGMLAELLLASLAVWIWYLAQPGVVESIALQVAMVASIGTLMVNANPLLKFDGYYLLMDAVAIPNLWQRSRQAVDRNMGSWVLRGGVPDRAPDDGRGWLLAYGVASRVSVVLAMGLLVYGVWHVLQPRQLGAVAVLIGGVLAAGLFAAPLRQLTVMLQNPLQRHRFRRGRMLLAVASSIAIVVAGLACPWREYAQCNATLVTLAPQTLAATLPGQLVIARNAGTEVRAGEVVAELENGDCERARLTLASELRVAQERVSQLELLRASDADAARELPAARSLAEQLSAELAAHDVQLARLTLRSPCAGIVLTPAPVEPQRKSRQLPTWSGDLLAPHNRGAWVAAGTPVAVIGCLANAEVVAEVQQQHARRVAIGQVVRVRLQQLPHQVLLGEVVDVAANMASDEATAGHNRPILTVRVRLADPPAQPILGGRGVARIDIGTARVAEVLWRVLWQLVDRTAV